MTGQPHGANGDGVEHRSQSALEQCEVERFVRAEYWLLAQRRVRQLRRRADPVPTEPGSAMWARYGAPRPKA